MTEQWPPAPTKERPWHDRRLPQRGFPGSAVHRVREVRLWGSTVLIDEAHSVFCQSCLEFVSVEVLGRADNKHAVGLPRRIASGQPVPMSWSDDVADNGAAMGDPLPFTDGYL